MMRTKKLEDAIDKLFTLEDLDRPLVEDLLGAIDFNVLDQAVRHQAKPVYAFRIDSSNHSSCSYRGDLLFSCPATLIHTEPELPISPIAGKRALDRCLELWLLEDMTFAVTACVSFRSGSEICTYRTVKTPDPSVIQHDLNMNPDNLALELFIMCATYLTLPAPIYEL